ncbi:hypothetical protein [Halarcobacter anaerophilus]|jgi:uncharacterized FlaG/YvyC family protein|uniref:Uncharacterized protein n=1 Tax=Halarcobacter anaerophilus TaxID=877500 RepID=A0A4Q0Y4M1_9BACT|nr:hypothetical protein [Halarcobacter anaerophilus]QDF29264.1 FlaG family protein [Halarcobacter anaerophilus]RXJ64515.1 hypothetical protein CRV06_00735 [Halarcobacter anaerophilus]
MEYGLVPTINQYAENNEILIQQVQPSNAIAKLSNGNEAKQIQRDNFLKGVEQTSEDKSSEVSETKEVSSSKVSQYQEVVLTNLNFGFNNSSRDFYVKAIRGESESQYPTDEMMKLKAYYLEQEQAQRAADLKS